MIKLGTVFENTNSCHLYIESFQVVKSTMKLE